MHHTNIEHYYIGHIYVWLSMVFSAQSTYDTIKILLSFVGNPCLEIIHLNCHNTHTHTNIISAKSPFTETTDVPNQTPNHGNSSTTMEEEWTLDVSCIDHASKYAIYRNSRILNGVWVLLSSVEGGSQLSFKTFPSDSFQPAKSKTFTSQTIKRYHK